MMMLLSDNVCTPGCILPQITSEFDVRSKHAHCSGGTVQTSVWWAAQRLMIAATQTYVQHVDCACAETASSAQFLWQISIEYNRFSHGVEAYSNTQKHA
jgi:hypothetical protein